MISLDNLKLHQKLTAISNKKPKIAIDHPKLTGLNNKLSSKFQLKQIMCQNKKIEDKIQNMYANQYRLSVENTDTE